MNLPVCVVSKPLVGQGALCPAAIEEAHLAFLIAHIARGGFDNATIDVQLKHCLFAMLLEEPMDLSHGLNAALQDEGDIALVPLAWKADLSWDSKNLIVVLLVCPRRVQWMGRLIH